MKRFINKTISRAFGAAIPMIVVSGLISGCGLTQAVVGKKYPASEIKNAEGKQIEWATVCGEKVAACCQTGCMTANSVAEFQNDFVAALRKLTDDENIRRTAETLLRIHDLPGEKCSLNDTLTFKLTKNEWGAPLDSVTLSAQNLGKVNQNDPKRQALGKLLDKLPGLISQGYFIVIELTMCREEDGAVPQDNLTYEVEDLCDAALALPEGSDGEECTCTTCEVPPSYEHKFKFNWDGIISY